MARRSRRGGATRNQKPETQTPDRSGSGYETAIMGAAMTLFGVGGGGTKIVNRYSTGSGYDGANVSPGRGFTPSISSDSRKNYTTYDRETLVKEGRWLQQNVGFAEKAVTGLADHIGYQVPQADTKDEEWNDFADNHFAERVAVPDLFDRSGKFDFVEWQIHLNQMDISDGDSLTLLTGDSRGRPQILFYENNQIGPGLWGNDHAAVPAGLIETDGVIHDIHGAEYFYRIRSGSAGQSKSRLVPKRDCIFSRNLKRYNRVRGECGFARAINHSLDIAAIRAATKAAIQAAGDVVWQEIESAKDTNPFAFHPAQSRGEGRQVAYEPDGRVVPVAEASPGAQILRLEDVIGAAVAMKMGAGKKLELVTDSRPHPNQGEFVRKDLMADIAHGFGVFEQVLFMVSGGASSAQMRYALKDYCIWLERRREKRTRDVAKYWRYFWAREFRRGVQQPRDPEWWKASFISRADVTIDEGRDGNLELKQLYNGTTTMAKICGKRGDHWDDVMRQTAREIVRAKELAEKHGLDDWRLLRPSSPHSHDRIQPGEEGGKFSTKEGPGTQKRGMAEVMFAG